MKKANIVILAGQSNAVGLGYVKYLPKTFDKATIDRFRAGYEKILINYMSHDVASGGFLKTSANYIENCNNTLGPEIGIAKALDEKYPNEEFFIVKCAFGATSMFNDWRSPSTGVPYVEELTADPAKALNFPELGFPGWCYNSLIKLLRNSIEDLKQKGYDPHVIGFCWMQGEADAGEPATVDPYIERYDCMLKDLCAAFPALFDSCAFVDAGISEIWNYYIQMNENKKAYAIQKGYQFIDTIGAGLTTQGEPEESPDIYHYNCDCTVKLGELFASAIEF